MLAKKSRKRRSELDRFLNFLEVIEDEPKKKSHIMRKANLNFAQVNECLNLVLVTDSGIDPKVFLRLESQSKNGEDKRRHRDSIISEILRLAKGGAKQTHIMYGAKLSFTQVKEYISFLIESNLLEPFKKVGSRIIYKTTAKGVNYLETQRDFQRFLSRKPRPWVEEVKLEDGDKGYKLNDKGNLALNYGRTLKNSLKPTNLVDRLYTERTERSGLSVLVKKY